MSEGKIGEVIGSYKLLSVLGEGGMGVVYKAEHTMLGRKVALKMLLAEYAEQSDIVDRFFTEAKSVNKIGHKNIIDIIDYGVANNCPFFIMELLEGEELAKLIAREGSLEINRAIGLVKQIASALDACHAAGVLHRDLKPENIFVLPSQHNQPESVKILDFGVAKLIRSKGDMTLPSSTQPGIVLGTPQYMAPEQATNKDLDERTDLYVLGLVFYEMLVGKPPYTGKNVPDLMVKMLMDPLPMPSERNPLIPKPIEEVIVKMLERKKEHRYPSMAAFSLALNEAYARFAEQSISTTIGPGQDVGQYLPAISGERHASPKSIVTVPAALKRPRVLRQVSYASALIWGVLLFGLGVFFLMPSAPTSAEVEATTPGAIELSFTSSLEGVALYEEQQKLGVLPLSLQFTASEKSRLFTFQKEGYTSLSKEITPSRSQLLRVALDKIVLPPPEKIKEPTPQSSSVAQELLKPVETFVGAKPTKEEKPPKKPQAAIEEKKAAEINAPIISDPTPVLKNPNVTVKPCMFDPSQPYCQKQ